jgi:hypothetical protein
MDTFGLETKSELVSSFWPGVVGAGSGGGGCQGQMPGQGQHRRWCRRSAALGSQVTGAGVWAGARRHRGRRPAVSGSYGEARVEAGVH